MTSPDIMVHFQIRLRTDVESLPIPDRNLK